MACGRVVNTSVRENRPRGRRTVLCIYRPTGVGAGRTGDIGGFGHLVRPGYWVLPHALPLARWIVPAARTQTSDAREQPSSEGLYRWKGGGEGGQHDSQRVPVDRYGMLCEWEASGRYAATAVGACQRVPLALVSDGSEATR